MVKQTLAAILMKMSKIHKKVSRLRHFFLKKAERGRLKSIDKFTAI
ncbi:MULTISPECIES: hypothetical protein [Pelosinus]|jgi:hypothetical protein|nr:MULTISPECIES: hypothetical protein [Pelosinus]